MCPLRGQGRVPAPPRDLETDLARCRGIKWGPRRSPAQRVRWGEAEQRNERVFAYSGGNEEYGACDDEEQEKTLALLCARAVTSARSAGGFGDLKLALFRNAQAAIDAVSPKTGEYPRCWGIFADAITD